ncbi:glycosyltransferase [Thermosynechococcus sp. GLH187]|uniref:glycosyltransferase n=1 Tax=unclassified Thermosynechococcus TaxID=2622553 RepID=UPI002877C243|nr:MULTISPECIES: glycosyltransferase [unclassified Thermosynechococcus]WNC46344.1 glycosyltransferase [Thermosynechococcus sp. GLH187]WNC48881.1 glycosyltransferase [Thermosynechococcus sp. GLH333]WNC51414.1 glycosyltransferase [Thermosynechococcus sp. GLH87]WNC53949.1 glycosyltransferase [Thermosynechococcus sp. TG215]WNC59047.1 glycosyltransferase [Thermosynechococcus sp. TG218]
MMVALILLSLLSLTGSLFYIVAAALTYQFFTPQRTTRLESLPAVSILVPVCGLEARAWQNWSSLCEQDYPLYEVLFGVQDPSDPAIPVLKAICQTYPHRARWYLCQRICGLNRKASNVAQLFTHARYGVIVETDSDVRVRPHYLATLVQPLADPQVGVVTCGYIDHHPRRLGAAFLAMGRCLDFIPSVLVARFLDRGLRFAIGPTVLLRREVLEKIGGFEIALNRIGEDYQLGYAAWRAGYRVELSSYILDNDCADESFLKAVQRELRWCRSIRANRGNQYFGMVFMFGTVYSALLWGLFPTPWTLSVFLGVQGLRWLQAIMSMVLMGTPRLLLWLWLLPLRDVMSFLIWLGGCFGNRIYWRGRWLRVYRHGQLQEIVKDSQDS